MPKIKFISKQPLDFLSVGETKVYLKVENDLEDDLICTLINAAVEKVEKYCNILLRECSISVVFNEFDIDDGEVLLPYIPCYTVTKVYTINSEGTETEVTSPVIKNNGYCEIKVNTWDEGEDIKVEYKAGYGIYDNTNGVYLTEKVPEIAKLEILKTVANWYENRETQGVLGMESRRNLRSISYNSWI